MSPGYACMGLVVIEALKWLLRKGNFCMKINLRLKGQCVGIEAVQSWWFHWQLNNNKTKDLCGFTVQADVTHTQLGRPQKYTEGWSSKTNISVF